MHVPRHLRQPDPKPRDEARIDAIDFWRGVVLCTIFVDHVPGNLFERLTFRNFGFSDGAEAFVFLSGMSLWLAYGRRFAAGSVVGVLHALRRRVVKLYLTHLGLSAVGLAIFALGAACFPDAGLMEAHGRDLAVDDPAAALMGVLSLGHQFGYFNILPTYIVLLAFVPGLLLLSRYGVSAMLGASFLVYLAAQALVLDVPTWPMRGHWFLDPFAWQFLMAIGIAAAAQGAAAPHRSPSPPMLAAAATVVGIGIVCGTDGFGSAPGLLDWARASVDLDKTLLGVGRLVHFLALAYLAALLPLPRPALGSAAYSRLCQLGRHGLAGVARVSLLAAVGQVLTEGFGHSALLDGAVVVGGLALTVAAIGRLDRPWPPVSIVWAGPGVRR